MKEKSNQPEIELRPDAWDRFERAARIVAKSPPQHRATKGGASKAKASRRRKAKRA